jgi:type II secretory pathway component PulJ
MVNLLMGLAMGLSILTAASTWAALQWRSDRQIVQRSHTQQELRALMDTLVHDIRRAQFQGSPEDFQMSSHQVSFTVNRNDNDQRDNNECSGFRLNGANLQTQTACQPAVWTNLNDIHSLQILALNFRWSCDNSFGTQGDSLWIELTSQASNEPVPSTWQRHVRLRNVHTHMRPASSPCNNVV